MPGLTSSFPRRMAGSRSDDTIGIPSSNRLDGAGHEAGMGPRARATPME